MIRFGILSAAQITPAALVYPCMNEPLWTSGDDVIAQMTVIDRCYKAAGLPIRGLEL
jgi:hypothetical protein